jgi:hypothetical protein
VDGRGERCDFPGFKKGMLFGYYAEVCAPPNLCACPALSKVQNSCTPNCAIVLNETRLLLVALRDLKPNEPLTVSRTLSCDPQAERRLGWLSCTCERCTAEHVPPPIMSIAFAEVDRVIRKQVEMLPASLETICCVLFELRRTGGSAFGVGVAKLNF